MENVQSATEAKARVASGWDLLDRKVPGWQDRVNIDTLNIASLSGNCLLSQIFQKSTPIGYKKAYKGGASFIYGIDQLGIENEASHYGFGRAIHISFEELTSEWKGRITAHKEQIEQWQLCILV